MHSTASPFLSSHHSLNTAPTTPSRLGKGEEGKGEKEGEGEEEEGELGKKRGGEGGRGGGGEMVNTNVHMCGSVELRDRVKRG